MEDVLGVEQDLDYPQAPGNCVAGKKCVYAHYDDAKVHKGKAISRNSSIESTTSSERRALAQYREEKNKNRPQRDGTPAGAKNNVGVVSAWQTTLQIRRTYYIEA